MASRVRDIRCILCGAPVRTAPESGQQPASEWTSKFRAVYYYPDDEARQAHLSGPGRRGDRYDAVTVGTTPGKEAQEIPIDLVVSRPPFAMNPAPSRAVGFPFHDACWAIFTDDCPMENGNIRPLLDVCLSAPAQRGLSVALIWGHNYGGYARCFVRPEEIGHGLERRPLHFCSDSGIESHNPLQDLTLAQVFEQATQDPGTGEAIPAGRRFAGGPPTIAAKSAFSVLPAELLRMILEYLPLRDALAVREASREFASLGLQDVFWRSRFFPGRVLGHILEARPYFSRLPGRWKALFDSVKRLPDSPAVANRKRIMALSASLRDLMHQARRARCERRLERRDDQRPQAREFDRWFRGKALHHRSVLALDDVTAVFVSTVVVYGRQYVSGIRMERSQNRSSPILLGYQHAQHETRLWSGDQRYLRIAGFVLALDREAVRGIAVITDFGAASIWVGIHNDLPKKRLVPSSCGGEPVRSLSGAFDAFRLLDLSVFCCAEDEALGYGLLDLRDSMLWYPDPPEPHFGFMGTGIATSGWPISLAIFGGSQGQDLKSVVGLTVWLPQHSGHAPIRLLALEVSFAEGREPVRLGGNTTIMAVKKIFFPIDGPGGEYIAETSSRWEEDLDWYRGFKVTTNRGRAVIFYRCSKEEAPGDVQQAAPPAPTGKAIIGFWRGVSRMFCDIGTVYIQQ